jgi:hypothetical protein
MLTKLILLFFLCNNLIQGKLLIKWIFENQLPSSSQALELKYLTNSECKWFKLSDNKSVIKLVYSDSYIVKSSNKYCNLSINDFDTSSLKQLDYYKPLEVDNNETPVYVLAYIKSFKIIKSDNYKCEVIVTVPDSANYSNITKEAIAENLSLETYELTNKKESVKFKEPKKSFISRITSTINNYLGRKTRDSLFKSVLDYTIDSESVVKFNDNSIFTCELKLKQDENTIITRILKEELNKSKMDKHEVENISCENLKFKKWIIFLTISFTFYFL